MTSRESPRCEPETTKQSVLDQRPSRIFGARRSEPTRGRQQRRDEPLIAADNARREPAEHTHDRRGPGIAVNAWRIWPSSAGNGSRSTAGRPITTSAARAGAASRAARYASRSRRRARLRCTARRSWRLTAKPTRVDSVDSRQSTMRAGRSIRLPRWKSAWNSALVVSRWRRERPPLRRSAVCGLSRDDASTPSVRPSFSSAHETRASLRGGACWVETSASSRNAPFRSSNRHSVGTHSEAVNQTNALRRREPPCYRAGSVIGWA